MVSDLENKTPQTNNNTVVIIAGKGGKAYQKDTVDKAVSAYKKHYKNCIVIGNGQDEISLQQIIIRLTKEKIDNFDICILAHGEQKPDGFHFMLSGEDGISSKDLFQAINKVTDNPVNVHIFSCHGGGALKDLNYLPDGSQAFSCCDSENVLPGTDVERYFDKLNTIKLDNTNLTSIMNVYMASMKNRNSILRAEKGKEPVDLLKQMIASTGTQLQKHEKEIITQKLSHLFDNDTLNTVIQKYANKGKYNMFALEVGCAMAITQLLTESQQPDSRLNGSLDVKPISSPRMIDLLKFQQKDR